MRHHLLPIAALALLAACGSNPPPAPLPGPAVEHPTPEEIRAGAAVITELNTRERLTIISHDSMGGRNTPSPGLEKVAAYLAANYAAWGLKPAGDNGTYIQRYTLALTGTNVRDSWLEFREPGRTTRYTFDKWATLSNRVTPEPVTGPVKILSGAITSADIANVDLKGRIVIFVQDSTRAAANLAMNAAIVAKEPAAIINLRNNGLAAFATQVATAIRPPVGSRPNTGIVGNPYPRTAILTVTAHDTLFADDGAKNRPQWNLLRRSPTPVIMDAPQGFAIAINSQRDTLSSINAPNVVAMIEGSDPVLKQEYVVFSSHMDHVGTVGDGVGGCAPFTRPDGSVDNICNGADDDGSGTTGVMSVAQAVASLKVKPKRSILFVNVSGEEKGLLGSAYYAEHPSVPAKQMVANINMDMIGRNATDTIVVIGKEHSDMGATLARVQARHPELGLIASDDQWPDENFYSRSDHFNFAKKGVPVLFFFNGTHPQYHRPNDEVGLIDFSKLSRVAKLGYYFGIEIAQTPARPVWNPESYEIVVVQQKPAPVTPRPAAAGGRP